MQTNLREQNFIFRIKREGHEDDSQSDVKNYNINEQYFNNNSIMAKFDESNIQ